MKDSSQVPLTTRKITIPLPMQQKIVAHNLAEVAVFLTVVMEGDPLLKLALTVDAPAILSMSAMVSMDTHLGTLVTQDDHDTIIVVLFRSLQTMLLHLKAIMLKEKISERNIHMSRVFLLLQPNING